MNIRPSLPVAAAPILAACALLTAPALANAAATFNGFASRPVVIIGSILSADANNVSGGSGYSGPQDTVGAGSLLTCEPGTAIVVGGGWTYRYRWVITEGDNGGNYVPITGLGEADAADGDNTYRVQGDNLHRFVGCEVDVVDTASDTVIGGAYLGSCFPWPYTSPAEVYAIEGPLTSQNTFIGDPFLKDPLAGPNDPYRAGDPLVCTLANLGDIDTSIGASYSYKIYQMNYSTNQIELVSNSGMYTPTTQDISNNYPLWCTVTVTLSDAESTVISSDPEGDGTQQHAFQAHTFLPVRAVQTEFEMPHLTVNGGGDATYGKTLTCSTATPLSDTPYDRYEYMFVLARTQSDLITVFNESGTYTVTADDITKVTQCFIYGQNYDPDNDSYYNVYGAVSDEILHIERPAMNPVIRIAGDPHVGQQLTCEPGQWSTGDAGIATLTWVIDGQVVATGSQYTPTQADLGKTISCVSTLRDDTGEILLTTAASAPTNPISAFPTGGAHIAITAGPTQGAEAVEGAQLSCDLGADTSALTNVSISYVWLIDGAQVATGKSFTLGEQHVGHTIACRITLTSDELDLTVTTQALIVRGAPAGDPDPLAPCSPANDLIITGAGDDVICGGAGEDVIYSGAGNDRITGGPGHDTIYSGSGNDRIVGGDGNDIVYAASGDDTVIGGNGRDNVQAGAGADAVSGGAGNDVAYGQAGDDRLIGGDGNDDLWGGDGADIIAGGGQADRLVGGAGNDVISGAGGSDYISGGNGNDRLSGGDMQDQMMGGRGHDVMSGGAGSDHLFGLEGNDILSGGSGNDRLAGGSGADHMNGNAGTDTLSGGPGNDRITGGPGTDVMFGNGGTDTIFDSQLSDVIREGVAN